MESGPNTIMIPLPKGFSVAGVRCGLKNKRNDLGLIVSDRVAKSAGVFTSNHVRASCVDYTRGVADSGQMSAIVVNSGNANCCNGPQGVRDTHRMAELAGELLSLDPDQIGVGSTGVIGHLLDMSKVEKGIAEASHKLGPDVRPFIDAILTTDLVEKWAWVHVGAEEVVTPQSPAQRKHDLSNDPLIIGFAKGSGMIGPNMATMLCYMITDADVEGLDLQPMLKRAADASFNCMTVDGDTSTNDMLVMMANGASGHKADEAEFEAALTAVCVSLAKQVARDGEGATKLIEVRVQGTADPMKIARTIAESPLVKTAMFGCDPNWGRVLMAAGRAGVPFCAKQVRLSLTAGDEEHVLFEDDAPASFDPKRVSTALKSDHVLIDLRLGEGETATVYTCDFGYGYVRINAEYHT